MDQYAVIVTPLINLPGVSKEPTMAVILDTPDHVALLLGAGFRAVMLQGYHAAMYIYLNDGGNYTCQITDRAQALSHLYAATPEEAQNFVVSNFSVLTDQTKPNTRLH